MQVFFDLKRYKRPTADGTTILSLRVLAKESTPTRCLNQWYKKNITKSIQAKRTEAFTMTQSKEELWHQNLKAA